MSPNNSPSQRRRIKQLLAVMIGVGAVLTLTVFLITARACYPDGNHAEWVTYRDWTPESEGRQTEPAAERFSAAKQALIERVEQLDHRSHVLRRKAEAVNNSQLLEALNATQARIEQTKERVVTLEPSGSGGVLKDERQLADQLSSLDHQLDGAEKML